MNPPIDDILDLFPPWLSLTPSPVEYCSTAENNFLSQPIFQRTDQYYNGNNVQLQESEGRCLNPDFPVLAPPPFTPSTPTPSLNDIMNYKQGQDNSISPTLSSPSSFYSFFANPYLEVPSAAKRNSRVGFCEHPKHGLYRQSHPNNKTVHNQLPPQYASQHHHHHYHHQNTCQKHICKKLCHHHHFLHHHNQQEEASSSANASIAATPRRGRPPKGTKPSERLSYCSPIDLSLAIDHHFNNEDNNSSSIYNHIAMTIRPLPKRLESVVGKANIHVCLTCLKRSDMDFDYLMNPAYIGPQSTKKRKRETPLL
ncbi:hypothetical protein BCR42DRAFT_489529 [Absidia repens]|uniref:Uncharacterized protein n=1 Tax=Absidia repens TaxID=90262 RepID=A0A1X2INL9_9FUNG|nr:hypothetical protein BCR42DRAFT_489529 [Absidia repens]